MRYAFDNLLDLSRVVMAILSWVVEFLETNIKFKDDKNVIYIPRIHGNPITTNQRQYGVFFGRDTGHSLAGVYF